MKFNSLKFYNLFGRGNSGIISRHFSTANTSSVEDKSCENVPHLLSTSCLFFKDPTLQPFPHPNVPFQPAFSFQFHHSRQFPYHVSHSPTTGRFCRLCFSSGMLFFKMRFIFRFSIKGDYTVFVFLCVTDLT